MIIRVHARGTLVGAAIRRAYAARAVTDPAPQLVAAWAGSGELADLEPAPRPGGYDTTRLAALLAEPMRAGATTPTRPVWRCTLELDPTERRLTHQEWAAAVRDLLDEAGLAPHGDRNAVRWIAIAHGHARSTSFATLVRQDA
ncbi:relaxase, partial [Salinispora arenicola]|nr:relaxase [Salinispora arenicola]